MAKVYEWQAVSYKVGERDSLRNVKSETGGLIEDEIWYSVKAKTDVRIVVVDASGQPTGKVYSGKMWDLPREVFLWHVAGHPSDEAYPLYPVVWADWNGLHDEYQSASHAVAAFFRAQNREQQAKLIDRWRAHGAQYSTIARIVGWRSADVRLLHHSSRGGDGFAENSLGSLVEQHRRRVEIAALAEQGLSKKDIAERMGVTSSRIAQILGRTQAAEGTRTLSADDDAPQARNRMRN